MPSEKTAPGTKSETAEASESTSQVEQNTPDQSPDAPPAPRDTAEVAAAAAQTATDDSSNGSNGKKVSKKRSARVASQHHESKLAQAPTQSAADALKAATNNMKQRGATAEDLPDDTPTLKSMYLGKADENARLKKALELAQYQRDENSDKADALDQANTVMSSLARRLEGKFRPVAGHSFQDIQALAAPCRTIGKVGKAMYMMIEPVRDAEGNKVTADDGSVVYKVACSPVEMSDTVLVDEGPNAEFYRIKA